MRINVRIVAILAVSVTLLSALFFTTSVVRAGSKGVLAQTNAVAQGSVADIVQQRLLVNLTGFAPNTVHALTLDQGRCGGSVLWSVRSVTSDGKGRINQNYLLPQSLVLPKIALWTNVRQKNETNGVTLICRAATITTVVIATPTPTPTPQVTLPDTGVIPTKGGDSYNNYTYPLKH